MLFDRSEKLGMELRQEIKRNNPDLEKIKKLISKGALIGVDSIEAAKKGMLDVVKVMYAKDPENCDWDLALRAAVKEGHTDIVRFLVEKSVSTDTRFGVNQPKMHNVFALNGDKDMVQFLLDHNCYDVDSLTDLVGYEACNLDIFKMIIAKTATPDQVSKVLTTAAYYGHADHIAYLVNEFGVDLSKFGQDALSYAVERIRPAVVKFLLEKKVSLPSNILIKCLHHTWKFDNDPKRADILQMLVDAKADVNEQYGYNHLDTPLLEAAQHKSEKAVEILWRAGALFEPSLLLARQNNEMEQLKFLQFCEKKLTGKMTPVTKEDFCLADIFEQAAKKDKIIEELSVTLKAMQAEIAVLKASQNQQQNPKL